MIDVEEMYLDGKIGAKKQAAINTLPNLWMLKSESQNDIKVEVRPMEL